MVSVGFTLAAAFLKVKDTSITYNRDSPEYLGALLNMSSPKELFRPKRWGLWTIILCVSK